MNQKTSQQKQNEQLFFHVDLDAFYASVEQLDNPEYRGKPIIIGSETHKRGVVSTCSYEARSYGVRSAMPVAKAKLLCPQGIFVPSRMERYVQMSQKVMSTLQEFSPKVQQISIDEAFLDMSGTSRLFGPAQDAAIKLKTRIFEQTGLRVSVGIGSNKYIAKIASGKNKPDGLLEILPGTEVAFIQSLSIKELWGIGEKSRERLERAGLKKTMDLYSCSKNILQSILGESGGAFLHLALQGKDPGIFQEEKASHSISSERTFYEDISEYSDIETILLYLSEELMFRLLHEKLYSHTVQVKIRYHDFKTVSIQETLNTSINNAHELFVIAKKLFYKKYQTGEPIRLLGLAVCNVDTQKTTQQLDLFNHPQQDKHRKIEEALYTLSQKTGKRVATKARLVQSKPHHRDQDKPT